jgi:hypothetical protein
MMMIMMISKNKIILIILINNIKKTKLMINLNKYSKSLILLLKMKTMHHKET